MADSILDDTSAWELFNEDPKDSAPEESSADEALDSSYDLEEDQYDQERVAAITEEEKLANLWGKNKNSYYDGENRLDETTDEEAEEIEEEEAKRLQKQALVGVYDEDFVDEDFEDSEEDTPQQETPQNLSESLSKLTKDEKAELVKKDSPELIALINSLKETISTIREKLSPVIQKDDESLNDDAGISFLRIKYQLLLNYCVNLVYYLLMKSEGRSIRQHPVIERLVEIRVIIEKMAPVEKKLTYQIDKLIRLAKTADLGDLVKEEAEIDPMEFKPSLDLLPVKKETRNEDVYVPPRNRMVTFEDEEKAEKAALKSQEKIRRKVKGIRLVDELREEFSEAPLVESYANTIDHKDERQVEFEEEMFMRLPQTKADKKRLEKKRRREEGMEDLVGWDDFADLEEIADGLEGEKDTFDSLRNREDMEEGLEFYDQIKESRGEKTKKTKKTDNSTNVYYDKESPYAHPEDERRAASKQIIKNRGLTRYRKKADRNPRKKLRNKYEKALKKRKGLVKEYSGQGGAYGGERTGIRDNVTHSVKYRK